MSLKNKITLLVVSSIILTAALVSIFGWGLLKNSLINNYFSSEKEQLEILSRNISAAIEKINKQEFFGTAAENKRKVLSLMTAFPFVERFSFNYTENKRKSKSVRLTAIKNKEAIEFLTGKIKRRTAGLTGSGVYRSREGRPKLLLVLPGSDEVEYELDIINLWKHFRVEPDNRTLFLTDKDGDLLAHDDETRVIAKSNFSALEIVALFINNNLKNEPLLTKDEKDRDVFAVAQPILGDYAAFSITPYEIVLAPAIGLLKRISLLIAILFIPLIFFSVIFANKITTPLKLLSGAAKKVAGGRLEADIPALKTDDEIGRLADDFRSMTESLKNLQNMRDDLIHMIVHDLKSPLSAIVSSVDYLNSRGVENLTEKQRNFLTLAHSASRNLMRLIEDLLDVAKLEEGKLKLDKRDTEIKELLAETINSFRPQAEAEEKTIELTGESARISVDSALMKRVFHNLISNALKHTKNHTGKITVFFRSEKNSLIIEVSDNGAGIPEEFREKIFEKFVQAEGKRAQVRIGTGLGLTFCKMVVEAHGGNIKAESREGAGSSFIVMLPNEKI